MWQLYAWMLAQAATTALCQSSTSTTASESYTVISDSTLTLVTGTYPSYTGQVTVSSRERLPSELSTGSASTTDSTGSTLETSASITKGSTSYITELVGGVGEVTLTVVNGSTTLYPNTTMTTRTSSTGTSTSATPTNTQPCNGWPEFCSRKYGNVTEVASHNAAFAIKGNAASNQLYPLTTQLDDGIRMLTGETHWVNDTMYACHTSCDLLNAGTLQKNLETVAAWVSSHPYDVVTLLIVNSDFRPVEDYIDSIQNSGLSPYLYEPPYIPMLLDDWPTLSELILTQKRVIIFMDYNANQTAVPYIIDEFASIWETPFSPTDPAFPCTIQRPPTLTNVTEAEVNYMYLANHNLNIEVSLSGLDFLIPNTAVINNTNAAGYEMGMMGLMAQNCQADYKGKPPTWLLVDYYNTDHGSVFEVAARLNNVTWDGDCCGTTTSIASPLRPSTVMMVGALVAGAAGLFL